MTTDNQATTQSVTEHRGQCPLCGRIYLAVQGAIPHYCQSCSVWPSATSTEDALVVWLNII